ncbi:MAG: thiamine phosphate synthase [Gammaproteobacteria bacterium]
MTVPPAVRGVYLVTPDEPDTERLLARTRPLLGGIAWLQYRNKQADAALRREQASALQALCAAAGVPLIVNDDAKLAQAVGAAGVHLGANDGDIAEVRALLGPEAIVGAGCYDQLERAERAVAAGASYVGFGAFFTSPSKRTTCRATPQLLRDAAPLGVPRVAIGGLTPDNCGPAIDAGAELVATISSVYSADDPLAVLRAYRARFGLVG